MLSVHPTTPSQPEIHTRITHTHTHNLKHGDITAHNTDVVKSNGLGKTQRQERRSVKSQSGVKAVFLGQIREYRVRGSYVKGRAKRSLRPGTWPRSVANSMMMRCACIYTYGTTNRHAWPRFRGAAVRAPASTNSTDGFDTEGPTHANQCTRHYTHTTSAHTQHVCIQCTHQQDPQSPAQNKPMTNSVKCVCACTRSATALHRSTQK
jgi:hypothetical protein